MNDEQESDSYRLIAWILAIAVTVALATALLPGILLATNSASPAPSAAVGFTIPAPVKLYFASGKVTLSPDSADKLAGVVAAIKEGTASKAVVSGFHDKTGDPEQNAELSKNRAMAVRDELTRAGLSEAQVELRKPQESDSGGSDQEARRVEVTAVR